MFFVIDSSSVLVVGEYAKKYGVRKTEILNSLKSLVDDGKLVYPVQVADEVSNHFGCRKIKDEPVVTEPTTMR